MITFTERRNDFIQNMRAKINLKAIQENDRADLLIDDIDTDTDLMSLLEKRFDELFGPIDDGN